MSYTMGELRAQIIDALEQLPEELRAENIPTFMGIVSQVTTAYTALANEPFPYVDEDTMAEHKDLSDIFMQVMAILHEVNSSTRRRLAAGETSVDIDPKLAVICNDLKSRSEGSDISARLITKARKKQLQQSKE